MSGVWKKKDTPIKLEVSPVVCRASPSYSLKVHDVREQKRRKVWATWAIAYGLAVRGASRLEGLTRGCEKITAKRSIVHKAVYASRRDCNATQRFQTHRGMRYQQQLREVYYKPS